MTAIEVAAVGLLDVKPTKLLAKTLRLNKFVMKEFLKNLSFDAEAKM